MTALLRRKYLTKINMEFWLNDIFLKDGLYTNVTTGETDFYGRDLSGMVNVFDDPSFPLTGQVWQSAFKEWVHESGVLPTETGLAPPIVASGVTVDGTFYPKDSGSPGYSAAFDHFIDYRNGRIIFPGTISAASTVQAAFSYKHVTVEFADRFDNEAQEIIFETERKDNPWQTGVVVFPSINEKTLPMVIIDFQSRQNNAYELGDKSLIAEFQGAFHIWARDHLTKDIIEDALTERQRDVILGINFNETPFPLTNLGDKNPSYTTYGDYAKIWTENFWRRIYLDVTEARTDAPLHGVERSRIQFTARVYPTF